MYSSFDFRLLAMVDWSTTFSSPCKWAKAIHSHFNKLKANVRKKIADFLTISASGLFPVGLDTDSNRFIYTGTFADFQVWMIEPRCLFDFTWSSETHVVFKIILFFRTSSGIAMAKMPYIGVTSVSFGGKYRDILFVIIGSAVINVVYRPNYTSLKNWIIVVCNLNIGSRSNSRRARIEVKKRVLHFKYVDILIRIFINQFEKNTIVLILLPQAMDFWHCYFTINKMGSILISLIKSDEESSENKHYVKSKNKGKYLYLFFNIWKE